MNHPQNLSPVSNGGVFYWQHCYYWGNFISPVAKPPAGSSLLFGVLADSGRIKQRKNGSYRMVLKGVDEIDWFTDRPDRVAGDWSPKKLVRKWDSLFGDVEPNAQATFSAPLWEESEDIEKGFLSMSVVGSKRELVTFEMFKPRLNDSNQTLSFKVRGVGKKNKDLLTGLRNEKLSDASLFIDDASAPEPNIPLPQPAPASTNPESGSIEDLSFRLEIALAVDPVRLSYANMSQMNLRGFDFRGAYLNGADLTGADLTNAYLQGAYMKDAILTGANMEYATTYPPFGEVMRRNYEAQATSYRDSLGPLDLRNASLKNADLSHSTLLGVLFNDADLSGANLTSASLWQSNFSDANLQDVIWSNTTCPDGTKNSGTSPCTAEQLLLA